MRLNNVRVTNFRSVEDSGVFDTDGVTCLVGKNEAGKSAILLALAALNPHESTPVRLDKERDYPRRFLTKYDERHATEDAIVSTSSWELDDNEFAELETLLGSSVLLNKTVTITHRYGHKPTIDGTIDYQAAVNHLLTAFRLDASERAVVSKADTTTALQDLLEGLSAPTDKHTALLQHLKAEGSALAKFRKFAATKLPKFMYFSSYDRMAGAIQLEAAQSMVEDGTIDNDDNRSEKLLLEFLDYAGISIDDILSIDTYETFAAKLQGASNDITDHTGLLEPKSRFECFCKD